MTREKRKLDHIRYALELGDGGRKTGFEEVHFLHNCLTAVAPGSVEIRTRVGALELPVPVFIDAITGGVAEAKEINRKLATVSRKSGVAMAVGSQYGAVKTGQYADTYAVVREENPDGILFANISALATPEQAVKAVEMIQADALEIHLNVTQELIMPEGDKSFSLLRENLEQLRDAVTVPVIVKETGCGMAAEQIRELQDKGFSCFNIAGYGGTNFAAIEASRNVKPRYETFADWGIPTAWSLADAVQMAKPWDTLIASGGIRTGWQAAQAIAMGADAVGMSGNILSIVLRQGVEEAVSYLSDLVEEVKDIMVLTGCRTIRELQQVPLIYTGELLSFLQCRGYIPPFKRAVKGTAK